MALRRASTTVSCAGGYVRAYRKTAHCAMARRAGQVVGFASFHLATLRGGAAWFLDLLRPHPDAPDGTAHALVLQALETARSAGAGRISLAAVPISCNRAERGIVARLGRRSPGTSDGLYQFKASFAPVWQRLYIAGPSHLALALVGWEIRSRVLRPPELAMLRPTPRFDEEYEIASDRIPWQREGNRLA